MRRSLAREDGVTLLGLLAALTGVAVVGAGLTFLLTSGIVGSRTGAASAPAATAATAAGPIGGGGEIDVRVVDARTGAPATGVAIDLLGGASPLGATTGADGRATFTGLAAAATAGYAVAPRLPYTAAPGAPPSIRLGQGQQIATTLAVYRAPTLAVEAVDGDGNPLTHTLFTYLPDGRNDSSETFLPVLGRRTLSPPGSLVVPGDYVVWGWWQQGSGRNAEFFASQPVTVTVPAAYGTNDTTSVRLTVTMTPACLLELSLRDWDGTPATPSPGSSAFEVTGGAPAVYFPSGYLGGFDDAGRARLWLPQGTGFRTSASWAGRTSPPASVDCNGPSASATLYLPRAVATPGGTSY